MSREHFERIDHATVGSGLVPQLNTLFADKDLAVKYWVFDAVEETVGMPFLVRTRYLLPLLSWGDEELDFGNGNYPGLYVYKSFSFDDKEGDIYIKFPLEQTDLRKISSRLGMIEERDTLVLEKPDWWLYSQTAIDMTTPCSLDPDQRSDKYRAAHVFGQDGISPLFLPYERNKNGNGFILEWNTKGQSFAKSLRMVISALDRLKVT